MSPEEAHAGANHPQAAASGGGAGATVPELLKKHPNLYGDLSAGSGFNAISCDSEFGYHFIEDCQDKRLFGTDICHVSQNIEIVDWLNNAVAQGKISQACYDKVTHLNAKRVLRL